jgi:hypothetical protein
MKAMIAGMSARIVAAVNFVAELHPSCPQVSQNSVLMYEGVCCLMHWSGCALASSNAHDLDTTILSLTVEKIERGNH